MATLVGIAGGPAHERSEFLVKAFAGLESFRDASVHFSELGPASFGWSAPPALTSSRADAGPASAFVLGSPGFGQSGLGNALSLLAFQKKRGPEAISGANGSYFAMSYAKEADLFLGADLLGLFPLYYASAGDCLLFSTTPSVFKFHPRFHEELSIEGLAGILLVNFIVGGQTLLQGVKRLPPGRALRWNSETGPEEIHREFLRPSDRYFGNSFEKNLEIVDGLLEAAVKKDAGDRALTLLSGGLDSRLLAGYLSRVPGCRVRAVTQGDKADFETRCAMAVAKRLGWEHFIADAEEFSCEKYARARVEHEGLSHGFNTPYFLQLAAKLRGSYEPVYSGVHGDSALGGATLERVRDAKTGRWTFEAHLAHLNHSGIPAAVIRKLIPPARLGDALENVIEKLRQDYEACGGEPFQRAWLFDLAFADRFQVGFIPRALLFSTRPVLPFIDRDLLEAVSAMPYGAIAGRRLERELVCRRFPELASLPLDRNSTDTSPVYGLKRLLKNNTLSAPYALEAVREHACAKSRAWFGRVFPKHFLRDKRFYYRTFDLNGWGWRQVRTAAERSRELLEHLFDAGALRQLWPRDSENIHLKDGITDAQGLKVILGLSLWAEKDPALLPSEPAFF